MTQIDTPILMGYSAQLMAAEWDPSEFQAAIFDWLEKTGQSQKSAADLCGVSQGAFNRWLQHDRAYLTKPSPETLEKLAPHIRISYAELMRMTGRLTTPTTVATKNPADLQALIRHLEQAWADADAVRRELVGEVVRAVVPLHKRARKPRTGRNPEQPDDPFKGLLTHKSPVLSVA